MGRPEHLEEISHVGVPKVVVEPEDHLFLRRRGRIRATWSPGPGSLFLFLGVGHGLRSVGIGN